MEYFSGMKLLASFQGDFLNKNLDLTTLGLVSGASIFQQGLKRFSSLRLFSFSLQVVSKTGYRELKVEKSL